MLEVSRVASGEERFPLALMKYQLRSTSAPAESSGPVGSSRDDYIPREGAYPSGDS